MSPNVIRFRRARFGDTDRRERLLAEIPSSLQVLPGLGLQADEEILQIQIQTPETRLRPDSERSEVDHRAGNRVVPARKRQARM